MKKEQHTGPTADALQQPRDLRAHRSSGGTISPSAGQLIIHTLTQLFAHARCLLTPAQTEGWRDGGGRRAALAG